MKTRLMLGLCSLFLLSFGSSVEMYGQDNCNGIEEFYWGSVIGVGTFECLGFGGINSLNYVIELAANGTIIQSAGGYSCEVGTWGLSPFSCTLVIDSNAHLDCLDFLLCTNAGGCLDDQACNYDPGAQFSDYSCQYPDECGICDGQNQSGCTDLNACNFDTTADCDDGSCDYSCCPGPGCCSEGMFWDWDSLACYVSKPADINMDGCVQLGDLLSLLGAYGDCGAEQSQFQCGDPVNYQGYDYTTVLIGEQCWFAENLRNENYENGDTIPANLSDSEWSSTTSGAVAVYGEDAECESGSPDIDACDPAQSMNEYGRLYNWYAVDDARGLCPSGWHVPADWEWQMMEMALGMSDGLANTTGWRGNNEGLQMKTEYGWYNGNNGANSSGFTGLPGGYRSNTGSFVNAGKYGHFRTSSQFESSAWIRTIGYNEQGVYRGNSIYLRNGFSIRCVMNAE